MAKAKCVIKQYNSYQDPETLKILDRKCIASEKSADLKGIRAAYNAQKQ